MNSIPVLLNSTREWIVLHKKESVGVVIVFFLLVIFLIALLLHFLTNTPSTSSQTMTHKTTTTSLRLEQTTFPAPSVNFLTYTSTSTSSLSSVTTQVPLSSYSFIYNFNKDQIVSFAGKLGLTDFKTTSTNYDLVTNMTDMHHRGMLVFDHLNGYFVYQSFADTTPPNYTAGMSPATEALSMLNTLGLSDPTLSCPVTYQRKDGPFTYVECHRDWGKIGAPIYNPVGLLNIPLLTPLASLQEGMVNSTSQSPTDTNVTDVMVNSVSTPQQDGYARPNDFNSVTVAITPNGLIHEIDSNMRWLNQAKTQPVQTNQLLTPQIALSRLKNHLSSFSLTIPDGSGNINWSSVYPQNQAISSNATITDEQLAYVEKPGEAAQTNFVPMYIFRGYATLTSGYRVNFIQMEPALANLSTFMSMRTKPQDLSERIYSNLQNIEDMFNRTIKTLIPNVFAQSATPPSNQLQLRTFTPTPVVVNPTTPPAVVPTATPTPTTGPVSISTPTPTSIPTPTQTQISTVLPTTAPEQATYCKGMSGLPSGVVTSLNILGLGRINVVNSDAHTFYLVSSSLPDTSTSAAINGFFKAVEQQYDINVAKYIINNNIDTSLYKTTGDMKNLFAKINGISCPGWGHADLLSAPPYNCASEPTYYYTLSRVETNAINVSTDILGAIQNNTLLSMASQNNIFSAITLSSFQFVFIDMTSDPIYKNSVWNQSCYISGESPAIFLYPQTQESVVVASGSNLTFTDPSSINNSWNVVANPDGTLTDKGLTYQDLYYEYNPLTVPFFQVDSGYVTTKESLGNLVTSLSQKIGLNSNEEKALLIDVNRSKNTINTPFVKVSLVSQSDLNKYLPLTISPTPDHVYRVNLVLTPLQSFINIQSPVLPEIVRQGFTVVEVGARGM